jgi:hypothetical protein
MVLRKSVSARTLRHAALRLGVGVAACGWLIAAGPVAQGQPAAAGASWKLLHPASAPNGRGQGQEAYDPATGQLVLFSGIGPGVGGDTWTFDGATWTKHVTTSTPPARAGAALAYDPASKQLVLFKGFQPSLTDTWTWNGSQWTQQHPATTPPGTQGCMATDEATGQLILFGGQSYDTTFTLYGGTWTWRNGDWTQLAPATSPPPGRCAMAYDAARRDIVLVEEFTFPGQTWTYDGTTWTHQPDAPSSSGVDFSTMSYDPDLAEVVAVGGGGRAGAFNPAPVWGWDGTSWAQLPTGPTPRAAASVAYDGATRQLVVFGGQPASQSAPLLSDTWVLTPGGSAAVTPSRVAGADRDATAVAVSKTQFPSAQSASVAVLARNDVFADALAGGVLAAAKQGPLLLTPSGTLDSTTQAELQRVLVAGGTVDILGGTSAISDSVVSAITALGYNVQRIFGADRFGTATAIADALGDPSTVFEASGADFPDALSAVPAAIASHGAIVLTNGSSQASATAAYLAAHATTRYAIGGPAAWADPSAIALAGADRYSTSAEVAETFFATAVTANLASGVAFADALSGGVLAGATGQPLLLVPPTGALGEGDSAYLSTRHGIVTKLRIIGGTAAVTTSVGNEAAATLGG